MVSYEICEQDQDRLWQDYERMSKNHEPELTNEEVITMYPFGMIEYTQDHLAGLFSSDLRTEQPYCLRRVGLKGKLLTWAYAGSGDASA